MQFWVIHHSLAYLLLAPMTSKPRLILNAEVLGIEYFFVSLQASCRLEGWTVAVLWLSPAV